MNSSPIDNKRKQRKQNEDQITVNSLLNYMNKNGENFSSSKTKHKDSNKINKKTNEDFYISLYTLNTKASGANINNKLHTSEKSKDNYKKEITEKVNELNPIFDDSDIQEYFKDDLSI